MSMTRTFFIFCEFLKTKIEGFKEDVNAMLKDFEFRTGRACVFKNFVRLIFVTKYRRKALTNDMLNRMEAIFRETMEQMEGELIEFGGEDDHVHLMVQCHPKTSISVLVGKLKGKSSYFLRKEFWDDIKNKLWGAHFWSPSYCVVSCGVAPLDIVREYVENQRRPTADKHLAQSEKFRGRKRNADKTWKKKKTGSHT
jgi:putative transposase